MKNLSNDQMVSIEGGLCVIGPGNSNGNAAVSCTGICLAGFLSFIMSDGHSALPPIAC
jgi:hypothetical protein